MLIVDLTCLQSTIIILWTITMIKMITIITRKRFRNQVIFIVVWLYTFTHRRLIDYISKNLSLLCNQTIKIQFKFSTNFRHEIETFATCSSRCRAFRDAKCFSRCRVSRDAKCFSWCRVFRDVTCSSRCWIFRDLRVTISTTRFFDEHRIVHFIFTHFFQINFKIVFFSRAFLWRFSLHFWKKKKKKKKIFWKMKNFLKKIFKNFFFFFVFFFCFFFIFLKKKKKKNDCLKNSNLL